MSFLLDTNVVSELHKPGGSRRVRAWYESVRNEETFLSVLVVGEIRRGIERLRPRDPAQAIALENWLQTLIHQYAARLLSVTLDVTDEWGRMSAARTLPAFDSLMAATARVHGLTFVTRNTADIASTGVPVLNPFEFPI